MVIGLPAFVHLYTWNKTFIFLGIVRYLRVQWPVSQWYLVSSFYKVIPFYEKMAFLSNPKIASITIRWVAQQQVSDSYIFVYIVSTKRSESAMFRIISTICWTITNERINKSLKNQLTFMKHSSKRLDVKNTFLNLNVNVLKNKSFTDLKINVLQLYLRFYLKIYL